MSGLVTLGGHPCKASWQKLKTGRYKGQISQRKSCTEQKVPQEVA